MTGHIPSHRKWPTALREAVWSHLSELANAASVSPEGKVNERVSKLAGRDLGTSEAWEWLLASYAEDHPGAYVTIRVQAGDPKHCNAVRPSKVRQAWKRRARKAEKRRNLKVSRTLRKPDDGFYKSEAWRELRFGALKRADGKCVLCGRSHREHGVILHVDHIKPRSRFPKFALDAANLQVLCEDCNLGKSNRDTTDWRGSNVIALPSQAVSA